MLYSADCDTNIRTDSENKQIFLGSNHSLSTFIQNIIFKQITVLIHHKTYIPHNPAFVYLVCFQSQNKLQLEHFHGILFRPVIYSAFLYFSVYTNLNLHRMFSSSVQIFLPCSNKKYYNLTFLQHFFNTCYHF